MKKKSLLVALLLLFSGLVYASDEVSIVVSSDGATKDEAIKMALRNAIEQTFGAFVSSNTTVLNDQLANDEIVSLSSGNVKSYEILTENLLPNNRFFVTLQATICMNKLVNYINSNSKGSTVEVNMDAFDKNIRLAEMNRIAEKKVLDNALAQVRAMDNLFDYELELGEPTISTNPWYRDFLGKTVDLKGDYYRVEGKISIKYNNNTVVAIDLLSKTLEQIKMTKEEVKQYEKLGLSYSSIDNKGGNNSSEMKTLDLENFGDEHKYGTVFPTDRRFYLRNTSNAGMLIPPLGNPEDFITMCHDRAYHFSSMFFVKKMSEFIIGDNISSPTNLAIGTGSIKNFYRVGYSVYCKGRSNKYKAGDVVAECDISIFIPKEEASKYKTFSVYPKPSWLE